MFPDPPHIFLTYYMCDFSVFQGMPFRVSEFEIARWFEPQAVCSDVEVHLNSEGKPSGEVRKQRRALKGQN